MYQVTKEFKFCAAHKLESSYTEACQVVHGHNYRVVVCIESATLNRDGMVVDFGKIKDKIKEHIDCMDHKMLVYETYKKTKEPIDGEFYTDWNPTAENIARFLFYIFKARLGSFMDDGRERTADNQLREVRLKSVTIWETETSSAIYFE